MLWSVCVLSQQGSSMSCLVCEYVCSTWSFLGTPWRFATVGLECETLVFFVLFFAGGAGQQREHGDLARDIWGRMRRCGDQGLDGEHRYAWLLGGAG